MATHACEVYVGRERGEDFVRVRESIGRSVPCLDTDVVWRSDNGSDENVQRMLRKGALARYKPQALRRSACVGVAVEVRVMNNATRP